MSQTEELQQMFATMLSMPSGDLKPETSLAALNTSLGGARVRLGLKRLGIALPEGYKPTTFGALLTAISGEAPFTASETNTPAPDPSQNSANFAPPSALGMNGLVSLQVGLDVEDVRSLPTAADYWENEFYSGSFSRTEIAYAVLQTDPRMHFAGFWCAKEALRKCDHTFATISPSSIAVAHDFDGRPYLTLDTETGPLRLAHALSISHTAELATAIVVAVPASMPARPAAAVNSAPATTESSPDSQKSALPAEPKALEKTGGLARLFGRRTSPSPNQNLPKNDTTEMVPTDL